MQAHRRDGRLCSYPALPGEDDRGIRGKVRHDSETRSIRSTHTYSSWCGVGMLAPTVVQHSCVEVWRSCFPYVFSRGTGDTPHQAATLALCTPLPWRPTILLPRHLFYLSWTYCVLRCWAVGCFIVPRPARSFERAVVVIVDRPLAQFQENVLPKSAPRSGRSTELRSQH